MWRLIMELITKQGIEHICEYPKTKLNNGFYKEFRQTLNCKICQKEQTFIYKNLTVSNAT